MQAEAAASAEQFADYGYRLVVHSGYHDERQVLTAAGAVLVRGLRALIRRCTHGDPAPGEPRLRPPRRPACWFRVIGYLQSVHLSRDTDISVPRSW